MTITLDILGVPRPQARPRVYRTPAGVRTVSPHTDWHDRVYLAALHARASHGMLRGVPLRVAMEFRMPRPKSYPKRSERPHVGRPDCDNCAKLVLDALTGVLLERDEAVTQLEVSKRYALAGESPGCRMEIAPAEEYRIVPDADGGL